MKILVASTNPGKLKELSQMLDSDNEFVGLTQFSDAVEVEEDGESFEENARKKALGYARQTGMWTIADDSGLCVDALDGEPGIRSARYSGEKNRGLLDHKNMAMVLDLLKDTPNEKRSARFVCCICLAKPGKVLAETRGTVEGQITKTKAGNNGFGYDPIFLLPEKNKTIAELDAAEKNAVSHRGNAIAKLKPILEKLTYNI